MSFSAKKIRFLVDFSFVSRHFGLIKQLVLVEEFLLSEDKLQHGTELSITRETVVKKATSKPQKGFLLSGQVLQFKCEKDCFSQVKETAQFSYMTWRE